MPINGLSDRQRMPRLGKIRLGIKKENQSGVEYPAAVDYFVCPGEVQQVYGDKPRELDIMFPVNDPEKFFPQWLKRYNKSNGLICKGDGERVMMRIDTETGEVFDEEDEIECNPIECEWFLKKHCRQMANLMFLLPKVQGLGAYQIDTSSYHSIVNLNSNVAFIKSLTRGTIAGIPLRLIVKPQEVTPDGKKKTVYVMDLVAPGLRLEQFIKQARAALPIGETYEAPTPDETRDSDFYPDGVVDDGHTAADKAKDGQTSSDGGQTTQPDPVDKDIEQAFDILGYPPGRRATRRQAVPDREQLLKQLQAEIDQKNSGTEQETKRPSSKPRGQTKPPEQNEDLKPTGTNGKGPQRRLF